MSYVFPFNNNTYVPDDRSSGGLTVEFSRNAADFSLPRYIGIMPVSKPKGYYRQMLNEESARVFTNPNDYIWADGNDEPEGVINTEGHTFPAFECVRYAYPWKLGLLAAENASWDIVEQEARIQASRAMLARTMRVLNVLTTSGNWGANTATATSLGGGKWNAGTGTAPYARTGILTAVQKIVQATNGVVKLKDLQLVISPALAVALSTSVEFLDFIKQSPDARPNWEGEGSDNASYNLPPKLFGLNLVIEDAVRVSSQKGTTRSDGFALGSTNALVLAKKDALVAEGARSFNTFTLFAYGTSDFVHEVKTDIDNKTIKGRVIENTSEIMTAPMSGFLVTSCI